jgi:hypothetical protein
LADISEYVPAKYVEKARPAGINTPGLLATSSDSGFGRRPEFEAENIYSTPRDNSVFFRVTLPKECFQNNTAIARNVSKSTLLIWIIDAAGGSMVKG